MNTKDQISLLEVVENSISDHWQNMPEYNNINKPDPVITATFKFRNEEDFNKFHALLKQHIYNGEKIFDGMQKKDKKSAWFPLNEKASHYEYR